MTNIRGIDVVWLLFLAALASLGLTKPEHSPFEWLALLALGAAQILEGRFGTGERAVTRTIVAIAVKLGLCSLLVWATGGIESSYYLIYLLPIVSSASRFGLGSALGTTAVASALYLAFLPPVLDSYYVPPEGQRELTVRVLFFFLSAILVNRLATENRLQTQRLAETNRELGKAQAAVRRSERLAALGQLSAGLAHEIRNPLGVISASAELLARNVGAENEVSRELAGNIRSEVNRTNILVTHFLDFARPAALSREPADLNETVTRALDQIRDSAKSSDPPVEIRADLRSLPSFAFDPTLIESALLNLFVNAREAMPQGGRLHVATSRNGDYARIVISDSGTGIPAEKMEDVFNPFFTTKPTGVGLGLPMVQKFIDSHGGSIEVDSREGVGTTFRIRLPLNESL